MLGPWAVPGGTNANGDKSEIHSRPMDNEANMVATSSAQVESLQVGPVSDRAGNVRTPLLGIPLKAGEAVRRTEAGIPPEPLAFLGPHTFAAPSLVPGIPVRLSS